MAAFGMAAVRWRSRRDPAGGPPLVSLSFLTDPAGQRTAAITAGVARYLASLAGRRRREYDADVAAEIAGDRRLALGLVAVCLDWYRWSAPPFEQALPAHVAAALARAGVDSPSALRLRLFDLVNAHESGFVPTTRRAAMIDRLAGSLGLTEQDTAALDVAVTLDHEDESVLMPVERGDDPAPPDPAEIVARYNRALLAAILRQSERIVFTVHAPDGGAIRRLYALCRALGVYCDIEQLDQSIGAAGTGAARRSPELPAGRRLVAEDTAAQRYSAVAQPGLGALAAGLDIDPPDDGSPKAERRSAGPPGARAGAVQTVAGPTPGRQPDVWSIIPSAPVDASPGAPPRSDVYRLTLAGPDAVVGPPAAAGPRLATVARRLLRRLGPLDRGVAHLVINDRAYVLPLDGALLRVPGLAPDLVDGDAEPAAPTAGDAFTWDGTAALPPPSDRHDPADSYDSDVEARLARSFAALRRQRRAAGWRLVREPAPLMAGGRVVLPDFALERGELRVFVEVMGFWTPGYLVRKRAALEKLAPDLPLILAVAESSAHTLAGLPFAVVPYRTSVPVHELLAIAEARYGDFAARTAGAGDRLARACAAEQGGRLSDATLATLLACYSPGELQRTLAAAAPPAGWRYIPTVGLCAPELLTRIGAALRQIWAAGDPAQRLTLTRVRSLLLGLPLPDGDQPLAALLGQIPDCTVLRGSLFETEVGPPGAALPYAYPPAPPAKPVRARNAAPAAPRPSASRRGPNRPARPTLL